MKINHRFAIGLTLALAIMLTMSFVNAVDIGTTQQTVPFEASPTATLTGSSTSGAGTAASARDTILATSQVIRIAAATALNNTFVGHMTFENDPSAFAIGWVDLKMRYSVAGGGATLTTDDIYRIEYTTVAAPVAGDWIILVPNSQGAASNYAVGTASLARAWHNQLPNDGTWDWTDVTNLKIRIFRIQKNTIDGATHLFTLYEVWATIYPNTVSLPPVGPAYSVVPANIPDALNVGEVFFTDIYATDFTALWSNQIRLYWNATVLSFFEAWSYQPFNTELTPPFFDDELGFVEIAYSTFFGDQVGFTGDSPVARVYFLVDEDPLNPGGGLPPNPNFSWFWITTSIAGDTLGQPMAHMDYHGSYGAPIRPNAYVFGSVGDVATAIPEITTPMTTQWIEEYPNPGMHWHLTSWEDNLDGILSPSDQVDMTNEAMIVEWFHVEQVWTIDQGFTTEGNPIYKAAFIATIKGAVPEFPMGLGILMMIAPAIAVAYLWRNRKKVTKQ